MKSWTSVLAFIATLAILGALGWLTFRPRATLAGVERLLARGRFAQADSRVRAYLAEHPDDTAAHLLLAQIALDRPEPKAELALSELRRVHPKTAAAAAQVAYLRGRALFLLDRFADAERAHLESLRLDPRMVAPVWGMLDLLSAQDRFEDAQALVLGRLNAAPNRSARVQLLLGLVHFESYLRKIGPGSRGSYLEKAVSADPTDRRSALALGAALVRDGQSDRGLDLLRKELAAGPQDDRVAWKLYLRGLSDGGDSHGLARALEGLPASLRDDTEFDAARGQAAQNSADWPAAAEAYLRAWSAHPGDREVLYRLVRALRLAGRTDEAAKLEGRAAKMEEARRHLEVLYDRIQAADPGEADADSSLCNEMAETLEALGRQAEALAWQRLAR
jgi:Flp pilus assembly protein TadD